MAEWFKRSTVNTFYRGSKPLEILIKHLAAFAGTIFIISEGLLWGNYKIFIISLLYNPIINIFPKKKKSDRAFITKGY